MTISPNRSRQFTVNCPRCKTRHDSTLYNDVSKLMRCQQCGMFFRAPEETSQTDWQPNQVLLGLYEVRRTLGTGSFGTVYELYHRGWNTRLAVKTPKANTLQAVGGMENFEREAETWVNLGLHPHIVNCYYVRRIDEIPRVFMEYVDGGSLDQWIKGCTLYEGDNPIEILARMLDIAIQFAWGLHYAHESRIVHQDVKPANVMMTREGIAKVTDFGLAWARPRKKKSRVPNNNTDTTLLVSGIGMTPGYASPEQHERKPLSRRTDLWSWAVSVLEMFAGERVWSTGVAAPDYLKQYINSGSEIKHIPRMPEALVNLLQVCFEIEPSKRPRNLKLVADHLIEIYQKTIQQEYPREMPQFSGELASSLNNRAISLLDLGKQDEAESLWRRALRVQPHHLESTYNHALYLWRSKRLNDLSVVELVEEAAESYRKKWLHKYLLGLVHLERGDGRAAHEVLSSISSSNEGYTEIGIALAEATLRSQRMVSFTSHRQGIRALAINIAGDTLVSISSDNIMRLRQIATGEFIQQHEVTGGADIQCVALDERAQCVVTGHTDGSIIFRKTTSGEILRQFQAHDESIKALAISANRRYLLSLGEDHSLKWWQIASAQCVRTLPLNIRGGELIVLSQAGQYLLVARHLKEGLYRFRLLSTSSRREVGQFDGEHQELTAVDVSADGKFVVSANRQGYLKLWCDGRCVSTLKCWPTVATSLAIGKDSAHVLTGSSQGVVEKHRLYTVDMPHFAAMHLSEVRSSSEIFSVQQIYETHLTAARQAFWRKEYPAAASQLRFARAQPGYERSNDALLIWNKLYMCLPRTGLRGAWERFSHQVHKDGLRKLQLNLKGDRAISIGADGETIVWAIEGGRYLSLHTFSIGNAVPADICLDEAGKHLLIGNDKTLRYWDLGEGKALKFMTDNRGTGGSIKTVSLTRDGRFAVSGHSLGVLKVWDMNHGNLLTEMDWHHDAVTVVTWSPDGQYVLSGGRDGLLKLSQPASFKCLRTFDGHDVPVTCAILSEDGHFAISADQYRMIRIWDIESEQCIKVLEGHEAAVTSLSLSIDGQYLLSASEDFTLRLWQTQTGECLRHFRQHRSIPVSVVLSADGLHALSGYEDGVLKLWNLDWELEAPTKSGKERRKEIEPYLEQFCRRHTPSKIELNAKKKLSPIQHAEYTLSLADRGTPVWEDEDFEQLYYLLSCSGYGDLEKTAVKQQLKTMSRQRPPAGISNSPTPPESSLSGGKSKHLPHWQWPIFGSVIIAVLGGLAHWFNLGEPLRQSIHPEIAPAQPIVIFATIMLFGLIAALMGQLIAGDARHSSRHYPVLFAFLAACCMAFSLFKIGSTWLLGGLLLLLRPEWQHRPATVGLLFIASGLLFLTPRCSPLLIDAVAEPAVVLQHKPPQENAHTALLKEPE